MELEDPEGASGELDDTVLHLPEGAPELEALPPACRQPPAHPARVAAAAEAGGGGAPWPAEAELAAERPRPPHAAELPVPADAWRSGGLGSGASAREPQAWRGVSVDTDAQADESFQTEEAPEPCELLLEDAPVGGLSARAAEELRRERRALLQQTSKLKAKFELTLETLRSVLRLGADAGWADIVERCEALAQSAGADAAVSPPPPVAPDADEEREQLEENLEAQAAYSTRLWGLVQKQQHLLDMTSQIDWRNASEKADALAVECDALREKLRSQQDALSRQEAVVHQQSQCIATLEVELEEERRQTAASTAERKRQEAEDQRSRAEGERFRADSERKRAEVRELVDAMGKQEELVGHLRAQLQIHEAAERRRRSYHPTRSSSGPNEDAGSEFNSSVGSGRTSARGSGKPGSELDSTRVTPKVSARASEDMDRDERDAFLSHFPMSSRTERHMRSRLDEQRRRPAGGP